jgi:transcriptional accessory protein Tex/SPT6
MRKKEIKIRLSIDEFNRLNELKTKTHLAAWMREFCLNEVSVASKKADPKLLRQIAGIGNNINQIARAVNTQNLSTLYQLGQIQKQLDEILNAHKTS